VKVQLFYTADDRNPGSRVICIGTGGAYSHIGVLFTAAHGDMTNPVWKSLMAGIDIAADPDGKIRFYYESIWKKDSVTGKNGVRGPIPFANLREWVRAGKKRRLEIQDLPGLTAEDAFTAWQKAHRAVGHVRYAPCQIWWNFRTLYFSTAIPIRFRSPFTWTCVELPLRIFPDEWIMGLRWPKRVRKGILLLSIRDWMCDEAAPSGTRLPGIFEMVEHYRQVRGLIS